jgi:hypothetical protein
MPPRNQSGSRNPNHRHGMHGTKVYTAWQQMRHRCKKDPRYVANGTKVCPEWESFADFYAYIGDPPSDDHSVDRIDPFGNYEPGNVRWATRLEQSRNFRVHKEREPHTAVAERHGLHPQTYAYRVKNGIPLSKSTDLRKTHCVHGHELSKDNVYVCKRGKRHCKTCRRNRARKLREKRRS